MPGHVGAGYAPAWHKKQAKPAATLENGKLFLDEYIVSHNQQKSEQDDDDDTSYERFTRMVEKWVSSDYRCPVQQKLRSVVPFHRFSLQNLSHLIDGRP